MNYLHFTDRKTKAERQSNLPKAVDLQVCSLKAQDLYNGYIIKAIFTIIQKCYLWYCVNITLGVKTMVGKTAGALA